MCVVLKDSSAEAGSAPEEAHTREELAPFSRCPAKKSQLSPSAKVFTPPFSAGVEQASSSPPADSLSLALLAQQLPQLPKFSGDNLEGDGETFDDWSEQLELAAEACGWNE